MYFAKMKGSVLVGLLGALRLFGGFPYVFRSTEGGKMKIKKSIAAILWTCLIVSALVAKVYIYTYIDLGYGAGTSAFLVVTPSLRGIKYQMLNC